MPNFDPQQIQSRLQAFHANPIDAMREPLPKLVGDGQEAPATGPFSTDDPATTAYHAGRSQLRSALLEQGESRAAIGANDDPRKLVDTFRHDNLPAMEQAGLRTAKLAMQPWSGDYWATTNGGLAHRYVDYSSTKEDWEKSYEYARNHPAKAILNSGSTVWVNELSPAEKYDALVGDANETLTKASWLSGKKYFDAHKEVPGWFGICHGWSGAAIMLPRPAKSIKLLTPIKQTITFYPCEIKALASLLYASSMPATRFIGGRCNTETPAFDPDTGRVVTLYNPYLVEDMGGAEQPAPEPGMPRPGETEVSLGTPAWNEETGEESRTGGRPTASECFDSNPGAWHMAIVNQIGVSRRSMVMDASFDSSVWNQPLLGYRYTYFNPQTLQQTEQLAEATTSQAAFTRDIFKKYRSPKAVAFVGIVMRVQYMGENSNEQIDTDTPEQDQVISVDYYYDLELDAAGKIIGGEWYNNAHPDFLWVPPKDARAVSRYEALAKGTWQAGQPMPESWRAAATKASADLTPLAAIVEHMVKLAQ